MSFVTDRYFQMLENHRIYDMLRSREALKFFLERHVICVWIYNLFLQSLHKEIVISHKFLDSYDRKECLRLITETALEELVDEPEEGFFQSHLEMYIDAMEQIGANTSQVLCFFDLLEVGKDYCDSMKYAKISEDVIRYAARILPFLDGPAHHKAAVLFYEGEPYIPDRFLMMLESLEPKGSIGMLVEYFESHIEGLKKPGYSSSGRLVEILCSQGETFQLEAESIAERVMKYRLDLWNSMSADLSKFESRPNEVPPTLTLIKGGKKIIG